MNGTQRCRSRIMGSPMNLDLHKDILARLEIIKSEGIIADYWVSWVGTGGKLEPAVRTWVTGFTRPAKPKREYLTCFRDWLRKGA
jgi:hypothetical protein